MKIRFIGTLGEVDIDNPKHRKHSSTLFDRLLIDWGEGYSEGELAKINPEAVLLTHLHPDHYSAEALGRFILKTHLPEECLKGEVKASSLLNILKGGELAGFKVRAYPVIHSIRAPAVGYLLEKEGLKIFYSPDFLALLKRYHAEVFQGLDLWVSDGSSFSRSIIRRRDDQIYGHLSMVSQMELAARYGVKRLVFTHLGSEPLELGADALEAKGIEIAEDGMELEL